jgi:hypothetical protein
MRYLLNLIAQLFAAPKNIDQNSASHTWRHRADDERVCSVCGQRELLDCGGGFGPTFWTILSPGRQHAHLAPTPIEGSLPSQSRSLP